MSATVLESSKEACQTCQSWGYHLILDCRAGDLAAISCSKTIENFVIELVEKIDMKRYGEAVIVHFGSGNLSGYSLLQLIETSSITGHFAEESGDVYLDVFSCKPFSEEVAKSVVQKYFKPKGIKSRYFTRQA